MGITVREALTLPELAQVQVLAGAEGLNREILAVSVMEVPDISAFVEEGELLLTTTYPIYNKPDILAQLVPMLVERGLAGLAIKPERYIQQIPSIMIQQANDLNFPLLQLPKEPSFTKILNAIMSQILHQQATLLKYSESVHRSLTDLVLNGSGPNLLVKTLSQLIKLPLVLSDSNMEILAASDMDETLNRRVHEFLANLKTKWPIAQGNMPTKMSLMDNEGCSSVLVFPVKAGNDFFGYICILELDQRLPPTGVVAVEQAVVALAIEFQKQRAVKEQERRFLNDFVRDLLDGRIHSLAEMRERGKVYGWSAKLPQVILAIETVPDPSISAIDIFNKKVDIQQRVENVIMHDSRMNPTSCLVAHFGDVTVLLYTPSSRDVDMTKKEAYKLARRILVKLSVDAPKERYEVNIGISRLCEDLKGLTEGFRQATEALLIRKQTAFSESIVHYDDLGVYRLLVRISDLEELERFCEEHLGEILAYDRTRGTELMATLNAVIEANGNMNLAANQLFIHYNTLRYRVKKIESLSGIKMDSWQSMMEASVALKAYHILQIRKRSR